MYRLLIGELNISADIRSVVCDTYAYVISQIRTQTTNVIEYILTDFSIKHVNYYGIVQKYSVSYYHMVGHFTHIMHMRACIVQEIVEPLQWRMNNWDTIVTLHRTVARIKCTIWLLYHDNVLTGVRLHVPVEQFVVRS